MNLSTSSTLKCLQTSWCIRVLVGKLWRRLQWLSMSCRFVGNSNSKHNHRRDRHHKWRCCTFPNYNSGSSLFFNLPVKNTTEDLPPFQISEHQQTPKWKSKWQKCSLPKATWDSARFFFCTITWIQKSKVCNRLKIIGSNNVSKYTV